MKKAIIILSVVIILTMIAATVVESIKGTPFVSEHIYGAWWFDALWALLTVIGCIYIVKRISLRPSPIGKFQLPFLGRNNLPFLGRGLGGGFGLGGGLLHLSFVIILLGALITHFTQTKGMMHLRKGEPQSVAVKEDGMLLKLNFSLRLDDFRISYKDNSEIIDDYTSVVTLMPSGEQNEISMNNIMKVGKLRFYQADYDPDMNGTVLIINRDPWGIPITYTGYCLLGLSFILIFLRKENRVPLLLSLCLAAVMAFLFSQKERNIPVLNTWLLPVHVSLIITAYILLAAAIWKRRLLPIAVGFLAIGIFIGAYWANISWGTYWSWDSKEVWALITLLISCAPLHRISLPLLNNQKYYRIYMVITLLAILMTYFGVNYLLPGMHSYA